jgi:hypothetical protein
MRYVMKAIHQRSPAHGHPMLRSCRACKSCFCPRCSTMKDILIFSLDQQQYCQPRPEQSGITWPWAPCRTRSIGCVGPPPGKRLLMILMDTLKGECWKVERRIIEKPLKQLDALCRSVATNSLQTCMLAKCLSPDVSF